MAGCLFHGGGGVRGVGVGLVRLQPTETGGELGQFLSNGLS